MNIYFKVNTNKLAALIITGETLVNQSIRLVSNLILTRLLAPEMFGVMMIAMIFLVGITMLSNLGLREKYVQSSNSDDSDFINTCWSLQVIRGFFISAIVVICALILYVMNKYGYVNQSSTYAVPELPLIIGMLSVTALIGGFDSISIYDHYRNIRMFILAKINLISQFIGTLLMLITAYFYREVWVLMISPIVTSVVLLVLSYYYDNGLKAKFKINKTQLDEIISFSKWIFIGSVLAYLAMNADRLILGVMLEPQQLGVFSIAFLLAMAGNDLFSKIVKNVAYPKLAKVARENPNSFKEALYNIRFKIDIITFSLAGLLFGCGGIVVEVLYDERYAEAGWMFEILSISLALVGFNVTQHALMAMGKSYSFALISLIGFVYVILVIPTVYYYLGVEWVIFFISVKAVSSMPLLFYLQYKNDLFDVVKEFRMLPLFFIFYYAGIIIKNIFLNYWV